MASAHISPGIHFSQQIAANQKNVRDKGFKKLKRWLSTKSAGVNAFSEEDMLKLWKGLYYFFWMCDKPLVQEDMADEISKMVHCFQKPEYTFLYIDTFFQTMTREWFGIDRYRLEKFMMFVRKFLHYSFLYMKQKHWKIKYLKKLRKVLRKTVINPAEKTALLGLKLHIADVYMEELSKVGASELTPKLLRFFIIPYCEVLTYSENIIYMNSVCKNVFCFLVDQDEEEENFIKFSPLSVEKLLMKFANKQDVKRRNMKVMYKLVKRFRDYSEGVDPMEKVLSIPTGGAKLRKRTIDKAAESLLEEDEKFYKEKRSWKKSKKI